MIISDLNYLQSAEETNVLGGYFFGESSNTVIKEYLELNKKLTSKVDIKGNFAGAEADATALGKNSSSQAVSYTFTKEGFGSESKATSVSGSQGSYFNWSH
ncbi:MAG: hypothetical protein KME43_17165 [Myxacorys chilensis ATA2-1-KO14]|jgi:hypothetical protein|nr:hypothetical protein [Myxacorys chilensis ATA2-1-KO14]